MYGWRTPIRTWRAICSIEMAVVAWIRLSLPTKGDGCQDTRAEHPPAPLPYRDASGAEARQVGEGRLRLCSTSRLDKPSRPGAPQNALRAALQEALAAGHREPPAMPGVEETIPVKTLVHASEDLSSVAIFIGQGHSSTEKRWRRDVAHAERLGNRRYRRI